MNNNNFNISGGGIFRTIIKVFFIQWILRKLLQRR